VEIGLHAARVDPGMISCPRCGGSSEISHF